MPSTTSNNHDEIEHKPEHKPEHEHGRGHERGHEHGHEHGVCPAVSAIAILEAKWVLFIVRSLLGGAKGFNELRRDIGNCNPSTLSERLEMLEKNGIITKTIQSTMPPRTSYALTCAGYELQAVIMAIDGWARQHLGTATSKSP
jgi:DNA-binding HxlR family transcriptional regulator